MVEILFGIFGILAGCFALYTSYNEDTFKRWIKSKPRKGWTLEGERARGLIVGVFFLLLGFLILAMGVVKDLATAFGRPAYEIRRVGDKDESEREKLVLRLENELLKFERRLPSANTEEKPNDAG